MGRPKSPPVGYTPLTPAGPPAPASLSPEELLRDGALSKADAVAFSGIGLTELKILLASGAVPSFYRGRKRLVPKRGLVLYLAGLLAGAES